MMLDKLLESDTPEVSGTGDLAQRWITEIEDARKREQSYRKEAKELVKLYEAGKAEDTPFNILFSNTETLAPALYNSIPRPRVQQRFKDEAPLAKAASDVVRRSLEFLMDGGGGQSNFDELMKSAVLEALVVGRGVTELEYDATFTPSEVGAVVADETIYGREVPWDRFFHGYAKKWHNVPWIAFEYFMTRAELVKNFGEDIGNAVEVQGTDKDSEEGKELEEGMERLKVAPVYKIWDKDSKTVLFVSPNCKSQLLKQIPDPLGLQGFFPCPKPLGFIQKISTLVPVPLYQVYRRQARELNKVTQRIDKLVDALKVRGMYDSTVSGLEKVLAAGDNVLIPADNVAGLMAKGGAALESAIWLFPIERLVPVLQQLYLQRSQIKSVIYEITGIADIMRGSTQASETLGAQEIKNQWGTLRLKRAQKEVARYARDCLRIMGEIAVTKLSIPTLRQMTNLPFPLQEEKQQAEMLAQQAGQMGRQLPPELVKALSMPSWEQLIQLLQNDLTRAYSIDIETNSTVDAEATEDKKDIAELLNAISQFMNGVGPLIQEGVLPFDVAKVVLLTVVRRYQFGPELEDQLMKMAPPEPKPDPKVEALALKAQTDQQAAQMDMQLKQFDMQLKQLEVQGKERAAHMEAAKMQMEMQFTQQEHVLRMRELEQKALLAAVAHDQKMEQVKVQAAAAKTAAKSGGIIKK